MKLFPSGKYGLELDNWADQKTIIRLAAFYQIVNGKSTSAQELSDITGLSKGLVQTNISYLVAKGKL